MIIGKFIEIIRATFKISLRELGSKSKLSAPFLKNIENGDRGLPTPETTTILSEALQHIIEDKYDLHGYQFIDSFTKLIRFEKSFQNDKDFAWHVICRLLLENEGEIEEAGIQVIEQLNLASEKEPIDSCIFDFNSPDLNKRAEAGELYSRRVLDIVLALKKKSAQTQFNILSHYISQISTNYDSFSVEIRFKNKWLQEQYEKHQAIFTIHPVLERMNQDRQRVVDVFDFSKRNSAKITDLNSVFEVLTPIEKRVFSPLFEDLKQDVPSYLKTNDNPHSELGVISKTGKSLAVEPIEHPSTNRTNEK